MKCKKCDKRLTVFNRYQNLETGDTAPDPLHEMVKLFRSEEGTPTGYLYRDGFGFNGDNTFCSMKCGYEWALQVVAEAKSTEYNPAHTQGET